MNIQRDIKKAISDMMTKYPIIAVTGPRQSGKTTLLKTIFPEFQYVSLENPDSRNFAQSDPNGFLSQYSQYVIFDEIQRVPSLFSYLQTIVDNRGRMGQFILSGSQNFHQMEHITQSLAGRVAIFRLFPFDFQELKSANLLSSNYEECLVRGFYPAIYDRQIPSRTFYTNYILTYIQRDVSELIGIKDTRHFQNFLGLCATRAGQLLNLSSLANECGISQPTAKHWLSALESSYILFLLQPLHSNLSKRIVKTPKLYFYDTGLLCHLMKISKPDQVLTHPAKGALFENMMMAEYVKRMHHKDQIEDIAFWRDLDGHEVDLTINNGEKSNLVEFKATYTIMSDLFKGFAHFEHYTGITTDEKILVYAGHEYQQRTNAQVMPWSDFGK
jgi:predicted AAA+ superfamily ATPase